MAIQYIPQPSDKHILINANGLANICTFSRFNFKYELRLRMEIENLECATFQLPLKTF